MKKILSIDWDYFFPNNNGYDWGHKESSLFYEAIWSARVDAFNIYTQEPVIESFIPSIPNNFWDQILSSTPKKFYIADSHLQLYKLISINQYMKVEIDNLDAHHDCGYNGEYDYVDCGNWCDILTKLRICKKSRTFYPEWRKNEPENNIKTRNTEVHYGFPKSNDYDIIFMCRSSCWTPPWYDDKFLELINMCPINYIDFDEGLGTRIRKPNLKTALILRDQYKHMKGINCGYQKV